MPWLAGFLWASTARHFYWLVDLSQLLSALKTPTQLTSKGNALIGVEIHGVLPSARNFDSSENNPCPVLERQGSFLRPSDGILGGGGHMRGHTHTLTAQ